MPQKLKNTLPPIHTGNIGKRLADIRKSRNLTQTQLAEIIGIKQYIVSEYEIGKVSLSADMLARFCLALQCSLDAVFDFSYDIPKEKANLRLIRRLNAIDALPEAKKKYVLKILDNAIEANKMP